CGSSAGPTQVCHSLWPGLTTQRVMGEEFDLLDILAGSLAFEGFHDLAVQRPASSLQETAISYIEGERMLKLVLEIGEEPRLVQKLGGLKLAEAVAQGCLVHIGDGLEQDEGYLLPDHGGRLEEPLFLRGKAVDAGGQDGLNRHWNLDRVKSLCQMIGSTIAGEAFGLGQRADTFLEKERVARCALDEQPLERPKRRIASQEHAQQAIRAGFRQGIDSQLRVVALVSPGMLVLGPVARYNQYGRRRQAVDEPIEQGPGFRIRPVKVVEEQQEWLPTTLAQEETLD